MDTLHAAKSFATLHHIILPDTPQMYGNVPYTHHLEKVEMVLREFGVTSEELLSASWLHDAPEDCKTVKLRDIEENFGEEIALLVGAVTSEPGENRKVRNALTYPKIRNLGPDAVRLKLADRIANVRTGGSNLKMYIKEYPEFRHALYTVYGTAQDEGLCRMWAELDRIMKWEGK